MYIFRKNPSLNFYCIDTPSKKNWTWVSTLSIIFHNCIKKSYKHREKPYAFISKLCYKMEILADDGKNVDGKFYNSSRFLAASGAYLGMSSSTFLIKSDFSAHPLQALSSPQSERIFFKSLTFSFLSSTFVKSICLSNKKKINKQLLKSDF